MALLGSFAEQERKTLSENIKWMFKHRLFEKGKTNSKNIYGYKYTGDACEIVPKQAAVVHRIYEEYLGGYSMSEIMRHLNAEGIKPYCGTKFHINTIRMILNNERYTGTLMLQKTYRQNGKKLINKGELAQYIVEDAHPVIIDKTMFEDVQTEISRREKECEDNKPFFSGKITCGKCGATLRRINGEGGLDGKPIYYWTCRPKRRKRECFMRNIPEKSLFEVCSDLQDFEKIIAHENNELVFIMPAGSEIKREWRGRYENHKSPRKNKAAD